MKEQCIAAIKRGACLTVTLCIFSFAVQCLHFVQKYFVVNSITQQKYMPKSQRLYLSLTNEDKSKLLKLGWKG